MNKLKHYGLAILEVILKWSLALIAAILCVLNPVTIPIAVGFTAVMFSLYVENPWLKVIAATGGSIIGMWLVYNVAELAIILAAFQFKQLIDRYVFHLNRQLDGESIGIPCYTS